VTVEERVAEDQPNDDADEQLDGVSHGHQHGQVAENEVGPEQRNDDQLPDRSRHVEHQPFPADDFPAEPDESLDGDAEDEDPDAGGRKLAGRVQLPPLEEEDDAGLHGGVGAPAGRFEPTHEHVHPAVAKLFVHGLVAVPGTGVVVRRACVDDVAGRVYRVVAF